MSNRKKRLAWYFMVFAVLIIAVPLVLEVFFGVLASGVWRKLGLESSGCPRFVFISAICFFVAAMLQFPFREEEGWECKCGYDLSFLNKESQRCPECGEKVLLEWASRSGVLSQTTTKRLRWTIVLFTLSTGMFTFGIIAWIL